MGQSLVARLVMAFCEHIPATTCGTGFNGIMTRNSMESVLGTVCICFPFKQISERSYHLPSFFINSYSYQASQVSIKYAHSGMCVIVRILEGVGI